MKIPEMKMSGRRMRLESIMIFEGLSVVGEASRVPSAANATDPSMNASTRSPALARGMGKIPAQAIKTMVVMAIPKIAPASRSPMMMLSRMTGRETSRS